MVADDEDAVICDFLQYYNILDYKSLSVKRAAILACGLPEESRTIKKLAGRTYTSHELYTIAILDVLRSIQYSYVKVHSKGHVQPPVPILDSITKKENPTDTQAFDSPDDFERAKTQIING